jgi:diguanylate cyclase (GGDEF)-like protein
MGHAMNNDWAVFTGTNLFLGMNFLIAMSFAIVFMMVSTRSRSRAASRWFAAGFAVASLSALAELVVAHTPFVMAGAIAAFSTLLGGVLLLRVGVGRLYGADANAVHLVLFFVAATAMDFLIYPLARSSIVHSVLYQLPFALGVLSCALVVWQSSFKALVDRAFLALLFATSAHFMLKSLFSVVIGAGRTPKDYAFSTYALISQSTTAVLMVMTGLMLLAVLVLQIMADERTNSEVDTLSTLFNRRGFDAHSERALRRRPGGPHAMILCDLDHFKKINDTYGHVSGDAVIRLFGQLLSASAPDNAVIGRIGGEEFCVLLPGVPLDAAMMLAQALRGSFAMQAIPGLPASFHPTASFGVTVFDGATDLSTALRHADRALYDAKAAGRNCVRQFRNPPAIALVVG